MLLEDSRLNWRRRESPMKGIVDLSGLLWFDGVDCHKWSLLGQSMLTIHQ